MIEHCIFARILFSILMATTLLTNLPSASASPNIMSGKIYRWDSILENVALNLSDLRFCDKMNDNVVIGLGNNPRGYQFLQMKSDCYMKMAHILNQPDLCKHMQVNQKMSNFLADGSAYSEDLCRNPGTRPLGLNVEITVLTQGDADLLMAAGLTKERLPHGFIKDLQERKNTESQKSSEQNRQISDEKVIFNAYRQALKNEKILKKVRSWPKSGSEFKAKEAKESDLFRYYFAIGSGLGDICEQIAPGTYYFRADKQTEYGMFLRNACLSAVAGKNKDENLCKKIHPIPTSFPKRDKIFNTRKIDCEQAARIGATVGDEIGSLISLGYSKKPALDTFRKILPKFKIPLSFTKVVPRLSDLTDSEIYSAYYHYIFRGPATAEERKSFTDKIFEFEPKESDGEIPANLPFVDQALGISITFPNDRKIFKTDGVDAYAQRSFRYSTSSSYSGASDDLFLDVQRVWDGQESIEGVKLHARNKEPRDRISTVIFNTVSFVKVEHWPGLNSISYIASRNGLVFEFSNRGGMGPSALEIVMQTVKFKK